MTTTDRQAPTARLATQLETLINTTSGMHVVKYETGATGVNLRVAVDIAVAVDPQTGEETTVTPEVELHILSFMGEINVYRVTADDELDWVVTWPTVTPSVALLLLEALVTNPLLALTETPVPAPQAAAVETGYLVVNLAGGVVSEYGYVPSLYYAGLAVMAHTDSDKDAVVHHADGVISASDENDRDAWAFPVKALADPEADSGILVSEVGGAA